MFPKIAGFPPKSSILIGFSIINHPFWGFSPYFWKHPNVLFFFGGIIIYLINANEVLERCGCGNNDIDDKWYNYCHIITQHNWWKFTFISSVWFFDTTCSILLYTIWRANELLNGNFIDINILRCMIRWYEFDNLWCYLPKLVAALHCFHVFSPAQMTLCRWNVVPPEISEPARCFTRRFLSVRKMEDHPGLPISNTHSTLGSSFIGLPISNWCWKSTNQQVWSPIFAMKNT